MINAKVTGSLDAKKAKTGAVLRSSVQGALKEAAESAVAEIRQNLQPHDKSGALSKSVRTFEYKSAKGNPRIGIRVGGKPETARYDKKNGQTYDEALLLEYGTVHEVARPFFKPVIVRLKAQAEVYAQQRIRKDLKDA
jgi:HK97 gp10 family phage protein